MNMLRLHTYCRAKCPLLGDSLFVWVQGCPRRCHGCFNAGALDVSARCMRRRPETMARLWARKGGGLVLSGGEPFLQAAQLAELCRQVRALNPKTPILAYTGYLLDELLSGSGAGWLELLQLVDVLVDGPYVAGSPSDCALAGSGNQRVFFLSDRLRDRQLDALPGFLVHARTERHGRLQLIGTGGLDMGRLIGSMEASGLRLEG